MAPKPRRKGAPPKGQRSITTFLGGSPGGDAALPPPTKRPRTASAAAGSQPLGKAQQEQEQPNGSQQAGPGPASTSDVATLQPSPAPPRQPMPGGSASGNAREVLQRKLGMAGEAAAAAAGAQQAIEPGAGPGGAAAKLTPLETQIVALKRRHPGVLLCVEVGYKFKFFGADAETASRELGIYAFQDRAFLTAGFPTHRLRHHVRRLVLAGHKVGVVRQVETAAIKKAGDNRSGPFERKLTALHSKATLEAGELGGLYDSDDEGGAGQEGGGEEGAEAAAAAPARPRRRRSEPPAPGPASYLVCCVEEAVGPGGGAPGQVDVGLVAVEPSTGAVLHTQFRDGLLRQELESRLLFAAPAEILVAEPASSETRRLAAAIGEQLGAPPRLETAAAAKYKLPGTAADAVRAFYGAPGGEGAGAAAGAAAEAVAGLPALVLRALAHLLDHLRPFGLEGVLRLGAAFQPWDQAQEMRLSANTLRQLEVFRSSEGGPQGSLVGVMDHTKTKFGRRLMHSWVGKPLRRREAIVERLDAVQELVETGDSHPVLCRLVSTLRTLPDLERGLTRALHATVRPAELATLLQHLAGLGAQLGLALAGDGGSLAAAVETGAAEESSGEEGGGEGAEGGGPAQPPLDLQGVRSALLARLLRAAADRSVAATCRRMLAAMDLDAAAANDTANALRPNERYADVLRWREEAAAAERALGELLPSFRAALQISTLQFVTLQNQGEYLVEVPAELAKRVPPSWEKISSVKKAVRYHPPEVKGGLQRLALAREHLKAACEAAWRSFLRGFGSRYLRLRAVVQALAALDCLCGLALLASSHGYVRPELARDEEPPQVVIEGGRHPALELLLEGRGAAFVPNDTRLRGDGLRCQVVTGPNMGGKSCYSRQCALICIMAQVGSFVPASSARLRPLDAVLTRMGASDCLALGRSTFAEELGEASAIVSSATPSSLVILDELGRGTSTGDGAAIAEAVLAHVVARVGALTLFITHYPEVCFRLQAALPGVVACYRMAHVEEEGGEEETRLALAGQQHEAEAAEARPGQQGLAEEGEGEDGEAAADEGRAARQRRVQAALGRVVFLFRLVEGVAPASYGINVARMAQLPPSVLARAAAVAERVQRDSEARQRRQQLAQLAQRCRRFAAASGEAGGVDVEEARGLQELARQLLDGSTQT